MSKPRRGKTKPAFAPSHVVSASAALHHSHDTTTTRRAKAPRPIPEGVKVFLRTVRLERHLTQEELATLAGVPQSRISTFERGLGVPGWHDLPAMASALGMTKEGLAAAIAQNFS